jgi:hypothetical protein
MGAWYGTHSQSGISLMVLKSLRVAVHTSLRCEVPESCRIVVESCIFYAVLA